MLFRSSIQSKYNNTKLSKFRLPAWSRVESTTVTEAAMFESDDFDDILSQLDYSDTKAKKRLCTDDNIEEQNVKTSPNQDAKHSKHTGIFRPCENRQNKSPVRQASHTIMANNLEEYDGIEVSKDFEDNLENSRQPCESSRQNKKRMLGSLFDHQSKRKFPGPAGLLTGSRDLVHDDKMSGIEISSQDIACSQEHLHPSVFELNLWRTLLSDLHLWGVNRLDSINCIKQQELVGRLSSRKANTIAAFVEGIDRSAEPLIILRDSSGTIKCTLHRDAWSWFAPYIISEHTALALWKPTVLTTGRAFNKHYLSITLSNIIAIYCSKHIKESQNDTMLPNGYSKRSVDDFTAIRLDIIEMDNDPSRNAQGRKSHEGNDTENHLEGLDSVSFVDDIFF